MKITLLSRNSLINTVIKFSQIIQQLDSTHISSYNLDLNQEHNPEITKVQSIDNAQPRSTFLSSYLPNSKNWQ
mgnify:CR=1 FL=1